MRAASVNITPSIGNGAMRTIVMLGVLVALTAAGVAAPRAAETVEGNALQPHGQSLTFVRRCAPWDEAASRAVAEWAQASPDVDVRLVSDSIAGMRRARRLCELGSLIDACLAYAAVIRGVERRLQPAEAVPPMCRSIVTEIPAW